MRPSPQTAALRGLAGRCPACGEGRLFAGYLKLHPRCAHCGLDLARSDTGDGPAFLVILVAGALVVPVALLLEVTLTPPYWVHALVLVPLTSGLVLALLPPFKGMLAGLAHAHGRAEDSEEDGR